MSAGRGGACPARGQTATRNLTGKPQIWLPLGGKLSPQVTDEGVAAGHFPLIRRVPRHLLPMGEGFLYPRRNVTCEANDRYGFVS